MTLLAVVVTLVFGGIVGVASGLVGVGGGVLMVPFLYLLFENPQWSGVEVVGGAEAVVAHATSLLVIIPTAASGLWAYDRVGLVVWRVALPMAAGAVLAAALGAWTALLVDPPLLKAAFGGLLLLAGARLVGRPTPAPAPDGTPSRAGLHGPAVFVSGGVVGFMSALMGVGGGIVAIPVLIYLVGLDVRKVAATSIGIIVFAATAGVGAYVVAGWGVQGLPAGTVGYLFLPAALALIPGAALGARLGAALNQRMDVRALRWMFAAIFVLLGIRLLILNGRVALA